MRGVHKLLERRPLRSGGRRGQRQLRLRTGESGRGGRPAGPRVGKASGHHRGCTDSSASAPFRRPAAANQFGRRRSSQSRTRSRARRNEGMSSAKSISPRGSIHSPKTGRMARNPPRIRNIPAGIRAQRELGFLSQRVIACIRPGSRRRSRLSRRSGWA